MIYIKCFDIKESKIFYVISELGEESHGLLIDLLIDLKIKMYSSTKSDIENQNPFIQDVINIYGFDEKNFDLKNAEKFLKSEGKECGETISIKMQ